MAIQVRRREFIVTFSSAAAWPLAARAQHAPGKVARAGIIDDSPSWDPFRQRLRELNYVEAKISPTSTCGPTAARHNWTLLRQRLCKCP